MRKPWEGLKQIARWVCDLASTVMMLMKWVGLLGLGLLTFFPVSSRVKSYVQGRFLFGPKHLPSPGSQKDKALRQAIRPQLFQMEDYRQELTRSGLGFHPGHDDVPLHAWYIPGKQPKGSCQPRPCIIYSHGRGSTMGEMEGMLKGFMNKGYDVLIYEYPRRQLDDIKAVEQRLFKAGLSASLYARDVLHQPIANQVIMGNSLGSSVSAQVVSALQTLGEKPKGLIMVSSFPKVQEGFLQYLNRFGLGWMLDAERIDVKLDSRQALQKNREVPVLFLQGDHDKNTPVAMAEALKACIPAENKAPRQIVKMPKTKHSLNEADYPFIVDQSDAFIQSLAVH